MRMIHTGQEALTEQIEAAEMVVTVGAIGTRDKKINTMRGSICFTS